MAVNAILREIDAEVILRTGRRIPGIRPVGACLRRSGVVRMARDDAYGAEGGAANPAASAETAYPHRGIINRQLCRDVALFAFQQALKNGAKVFEISPKFYHQSVYERHAQGRNEPGRAAYQRARSW